MKKTEFNIEFVEFYPNHKKKSPLIGTAHVYIADFDLDYRGIEIKRSQNGYVFITLPHWKGYVDGEETSYPYLRFLDNETHDAFKKQVYAICRKNIPQEVLENALPA